MESENQNQQFTFNAFECEFICESLDKKDLDLLKKSVLSISRDLIEFNLSVYENKIFPIDLIIEFLNGKHELNIQVKLHDNRGKVLAILDYINVEFKHCDFFDSTFAADILFDIKTKVDIECGIIFYNTQRVG